MDAHIAKILFLIKLGYLTVDAKIIFDTDEKFPEANHYNTIHNYDVTDGVVFFDDAVMHRRITSA